MTLLNFLSTVLASECRKLAAFNVFMIVFVLSLPVTAKIAENTDHEEVQDFSFYKSIGEVLLICVYVYVEMIYKHYELIV